MAACHCPSPRGATFCPADAAYPDALDAHPLVREWFGERLRQTNEVAWKAAHGQLYEHLRDTTKEGDKPTLESFSPLYQAIAHGCRAGRYQEALNDIYGDRICRRLPNGEYEYYATNMLGALGTNLAAIQWFFEKAYETLVSPLNPSAQGWVFSEAAVGLRSQGRFAEALSAQRAALRLDEEKKHWAGAAINASNVSSAELVVGEIAAAVKTAEQSVAYADLSAKTFLMSSLRTVYAAALYASSRQKEAQRLFREAERRQKKRQPEHPLLYSLGGYLYCDLLLANRKWIAARARAIQAIAISRNNNWIGNVGLDELTLGRARLGFALSYVRPQRTASAHDEIRAVHNSLAGALDTLLAWGAPEYVVRGLLARAVFYRSISDWERAARDLEEVEEIAEPGPMRLYLCDMAIERARLAFARIEAFAPLNGMLEKDNPPKPTVPSTEEIAELKSEAEKQLKIAADYVEKCGYHRRDEELAELQAVLRGEKRFADLPPRV